MVLKKIKKKVVVKKQLAEEGAAGEKVKRKRSNEKKRPDEKRAKPSGKKSASSGTVGGATAGSWKGLSPALSKWTLSFLESELGFSTMAPVQAAAIPQLLKGKDVVVEAVTGSGKTLAYLVPAFEFCMRPGICENLADKQNIIATAVLPTRELAIQVERVASQFAAYLTDCSPHAIVVNSFIGGREGARDIDSYNKRGGNIIVGTPGRLYEVMVLGLEGIQMQCKTIELLILDEADRLLSRGFKSQLDAILQRIPNQRRTGLFSATQTNEVQELVRVGMRNPVVVRVRVKKKTGGSSSDLAIPDTLKTFYRIIHPSMKLEAINRFVKQNKTSKFIVYFLTCASVDYVAKAFEAQPNDKTTVFALHGQLMLQKRKRILKDFTAAKNGSVLLCTDVAARGLDIPDVDWVIQTDAPTEPETLVHRMGRTARMGKSGNSLLFLSPHESAYIEYLALKNINLENFDDTALSNDNCAASDAESESDSEGADDENGDDDDDDAEQEEPTTLKKNRKGGIRFRVTLSKRGFREKLLRNRQKRRIKKGLVPEPVAIGKECKSEFVRNVRRQLIKDRDLCDTAVKAFVTWVRAYREHSLRYIFKLGKVDVIDLAHSFSLLRLPNMPELQHVSQARIPLEEEFASINPKHITCITEEKEEQRQQRLADKAEKQAEKRKEMSERNKKREELKDDRTMGRRRKHELWNQMEIDELNDDTRLLKKLRQGKISEAEYAKRSGEDEIEFALLSAKEKRKLRAIKEKQQQQQQEEEQQPDNESDCESSHSSSASASSDHEEDNSQKQKFINQGYTMSKSGQVPAAWVAKVKARLAAARAK